MNYVIASLGILFIISSILVLNKKNSFSLYTKLLKFFPRFILGISLTLSLICLCEVSIALILGFAFIFILSEVIIQLLNIYYGRI